jgi:hypothetical protein
MEVQERRKKSFLHGVFGIERIEQSTSESDRRGAMALDKDRERELSSGKYSSNDRAILVGIHGLHYVVAIAGKKVACKRPRISPTPN